MSQRSPARNSDAPSRNGRGTSVHDGVTCGAGALAKPLAIELDFDRPEAPMLVYDDPPESEGEGDPEDDDFMHMIQHSLGDTCDCGNQIFINNQCTSCGAQAPWASKLGCGLA